jgi:hypothetical protein
VANATPSRVGQIEAAGAVDALWLKIFAGEVLTFFNNRTVFLDKHVIRTISQGEH